MHPNLQNQCEIVLENKTFCLVDHFTIRCVSDPICIRGITPNAFWIRIAFAVLLRMHSGPKAHAQYYSECVLDPNWMKGNTSNVFWSRFVITILLRMHWIFLQLGWLIDLGHKEILTSPGRNNLAKTFRTPKNVWGQKRKPISNGAK